MNPNGAEFKRESQRPPRPIPPDHAQCGREEVRAHDLDSGLVRAGRREALTSGKPVKSVVEKLRDRDRHLLLLSISYHGRNLRGILKCKTKSHLYLQRAVGVQSEFSEWQRNLRQKFKETGWERLRSTVREDQWCVGTPLQSLADRRYHFIIDYTVALPEVHSRLHALELIRSASKTRDHLYIPLRFVPSEKLSIDDRLLLAFDAFTLSQTCGKTPHVGRIIHGSQYATVTVPLAGLLDKVRLVLGNMAAQQASTTAPPLVLNKHCAECEFRSRCRQTAIEKDDLSLLPNIGEKERKKQNDKGIFTVLQLSYTFRPRRRPARGLVKHQPALKALALRKNQIHILVPNSPKRHIKNRQTTFQSASVPRSGQSRESHRGGSI
jgi:predicted RecB family nuclease